MPLETPEQIEFSMLFDNALERRAERRKVETEVEAAEVAVARARFHLLCEKIFLGLGLLLLLLVTVGAVLLWLSGEEKAALFLIGSGGGLGGAGVLMRRLHGRGEQK